MTDLVVVGQVARDLVLRVTEMPEAMGSADVLERRELLGGKGANQAVGARQLGASVALVGVVGDDEQGTVVLRQARDDGIDVDGVLRREATSTALLVDVVTPDGERRLLEDVPPGVLLRPDDVRLAAATVRSARMVLLQLQQPGDAVLEAAGLAQAAGVPILLDGGVEDPELRRAVLAAASVVRADATEAAMLVGEELDDVGSVVRAAEQLVARGIGVVALAAGGDGNVVAWPGGHVVVPLLGGDAVDPTGAGDAFVVGLATALLEGVDVETATWRASAAAALAAARLGGRPALSVGEVVALVERSRRDG